MGILSADKRKKKKKKKKGTHEVVNSCLIDQFVEWSFRVRRVGQIRVVRGQEAFHLSSARELGLPAVRDTVDAEAPAHRRVCDVVHEDANGGFVPARTRLIVWVAGGEVVHVVGYRLRLD